MFSLLFLFLALSLKAQLPIADKGKLVHHENFPSKFIPSRTISVWLPKDYQLNKKYAVLYMHDGQMLFDASITWNQQEWGVDKAMDSLLSQNKIRNTIVVGIWNIPQRRHQEYFPQKPFENLDKAEKEFVHQSLKSAGRTQETFQPVSDEYLKFIVTELKPFIDSNYATLTNRDNTFVAGSSMGGLISLYALCEYPEIFGGAACLSTHWPGIFDVENNPIPKAFNHYLKKNLPKPGNHKMYFDYGTETLDALYPPLQKEVDKILTVLGYTGNHWKTLEFKGADHSEKAWKSRLQIPLFFILN
ncbi:MAG: alpha/beta hydrolase [Flavobacterium sp.]